MSEPSVAAPSILLPDAWPQPPAVLAPVIVTPQDRSEYARRRSTYMRAGTPAVVIRATTAEEVSLGVQYAAQVRRATGNGCLSPSGRAGMASPAPAPTRAVS